ncbi:universal stress protein [Bradyrhizobium sp.]|uniref:universal stress protein n=1 Tax=Bradyrhizobium sp. TaxID=376 RepID=UPI003C58AF40
MGWDGSPSESFVRGQAAIRQLIEYHAASEAAAATAASRSFSTVSGREDISCEFRLLRHGEANEGAALNALHSDLVVVGGPQMDGLPRERSAESLLLATGVPFLLVPERWAGATAEHVIVAWNASREARRAIADALPLLVAAGSVTILVVDPQKNSRHGEEPGADVALYLSRHGAKVTVEQVRSNGEPVAEIILGFAERHDGDLIVIGAYSHSRTSQMIFGGVTQRLLQGATVPLLISH